jgi:DNA-binding GntR family transcriptional regulator
VPVSETKRDPQLAARAYAMLRQAILEGRLAPGAPLSRRGLARELEMSAVPVGDAISRLEVEGLVESRPRAGTRVRIATAEEIHGNYVLREALETHSARLFAEDADERSRERLLRAAEKLDGHYNSLGRKGAYSATRHARVERIHIEFHMLIARATGVPVLIGAIERSRVLLFNWIFTLSREFERLPERWHSDLAEALARGTPEAAAEAMRIHVRYRQAEVIERFQSLAREQSQPARMVRGPQRGKLAESGGAGLFA